MNYNPVPFADWPACPCEACNAEVNTPLRVRFTMCPTCGNKRCPSGTNHTLACTVSNEVGQVGSSWEDVKPWPESPPSMSGADDE